MRHVLQAIREKYATTRQRFWRWLFNLSARKAGIGKTFQEAYEDQLRGAMLGSLQGIQEDYGAEIAQAVIDRFPIPRGAEARNTTEYRYSR